MYTQLLMRLVSIEHWTVYDWMPCCLSFCIGDECLFYYGLQVQILLSASESAKKSYLRNTDRHPFLPSKTCSVRYYEYDQRKSWRKQGYVIKAPLTAWQINYLIFYFSMKLRKIRLLVVVNKLGKLFSSISFIYRKYSYYNEVFISWHQLLMWFMM